MAAGLGSSLLGVAEAQIAIQNDLQEKRHNFLAPLVLPISLASQEAGESKLKNAAGFQLRYAGTKVDLDPQKDRSVYSHEMETKLKVSAFDSSNQRRERRNNSLTLVE